jgi:proteasome accessory factor B
MARIHAAIEGGRFPNCSGLAAELGVGRKMVLRDIDYMRERLGLPIVYNAVRHGYYYCGEDDTKSASVTEAELFGLLVAAKVVKRCGGTEVEALLRSTLVGWVLWMDKEERLVVPSFRQAMCVEPAPLEAGELQEMRRLLAKSRGGAGEMTVTE